MKTVRFLSMAMFFAVSVGFISCGTMGDRDGDNNNNSNSGNDDYTVPRSSSGTYTPPQQSSSGTYTPPQRSSSSAQQIANAVVITLTYWQTKDTDIGGLDPKIYFNVISYQNDRAVSSNNSNVLLDAQDIPATWTGSAISSSIPFSSQADYIAIYAIVYEKDTFSDDDISPGYYAKIDSPFYEGKSGSYTLDYGSGLSTVGFNYKFVRQ